jgi:hypothetical protein
VTEFSFSSVKLSVNDQPAIRTSCDSSYTQVNTQSQSAAPTKLRIDVAKLSLREGKEFKMLERLLRMIQVQRQDFNGKVITVRAHDTRAIAVILDVAVDDVGAKLAELDLLFVPPTA